LLQGLEGHPVERRKAANISLEARFPYAVKIALVEAIVNPDVIAKTDLSHTVLLTARH